MCRRITKKRLIFTCLISCCFYILLIVALHGKVDLIDDSFTSIHSCPACFGENLCPQFYHKGISLVGGSKFKFLRFFNGKNVYYGKYGTNRVVLKKLAHNWELDKADQLLCTSANVYPCDPSEAISSIVSNVSPTANEYFSRIAKQFKLPSDFSTCPTERLFTHMYSKLSPSDSNNDTLYYNSVAHMMYGLYINPESVLLQAFSQNEGWPFPQYKGSCGRVVIEEYVGPPLLLYEDASWEARLDLSYQLLQIAQQLTQNNLEFALYLTDVTMDNFAVRPDGTLFLVDVENIVIVDRKEIRKNKKSNWNQIHQSKGEACIDCLSYSYEDLCSHDLSDHNFYAICKGLLAPQSYYSARGLLHSIPAPVEQNTNISWLLQECANPSTDIGRFVVVPKLLQVMKSLL